MVCSGWGAWRLRGELLQRALEFRGLRHQMWCGRRQSSAISSRMALRGRKSLVGLDGKG